MTSLVSDIPGCLELLHETQSPLIIIPSIQKKKKRKEKEKGTEDDKMKCASQLHVEDTRVHSFLSVATI